MKIDLLPNKKLYFASDFHLGAPDWPTSRQRESKISNWLDCISDDAQHIFLLGDIFDFWFEYKEVVPKGYLRFFSKICQLKDKGIEISFFTGNHDMWMFNYFRDELGVEVYRTPQLIEVADKRLLIGHGDGLGPGDQFYKILKLIFANKLCQWLFRLVPPAIGLGLAYAWSAHSRRKGKSGTERFYGEKEQIWQYCMEVESNRHHDAYIFGHRHFTLKMPVGDKSWYYNTGEWIGRYTYAVFDGAKIQLMSFHDDQPLPYHNIPEFNL